MNLTSLFTGDNAEFLDQKFRAWLQEPTSVEPEWGQLFEGVAVEEDGSSYEPPGPDRRSIFRGGAPVVALTAGPAAALGAAGALEIARRQAGVVLFINAWRVRGHMVADIDPLQRHPKRAHPELELAYYGIGEDDLDARVNTAGLHGMPAIATIREIRDRLREAYGGTVGAEFMNIDDNTQKHWVQEQLETLPGRPVLERDQELRILRKLADAESFEQMLHARFPGTKRFSLEGAETLIPLLDLLLADAGRAGVREVLMGMAHRGRLNVLANTLEKPIRLIVDEFEDHPGPFQGSGDVKYHLGYSSDVITAYGDCVHVSLTPNPSHLEAVNPVVEGRVRAKQDRTGDGLRTATLPVLLHGDAAFIGQGSVAETLQLSELAGYRTGGTIHIVVNNQIGFTTAPRESRSTPYATDVARMMAIPILHVNGEDPRHVKAAVQIAVAWRQRFHRDVVIDMYCYRKHGHNEGDEPSFTQPLLYEQIRRRPSPREMYAQNLVALGRIDQSDVDRVFREAREAIDREAAEPAPEGSGDRERHADAAIHAERPRRKVVRERWKSFASGHVRDEVPTGVPKARLQELLVKANTFPSGFHPHTKVRRLVQQRLEMARGERPLDWAMAEQAAFASLVVEGFLVRLSGQDSARGTFSQRHALWTDFESGEEYFPLAHLAPDQRPFSVFDSSLSEFAVLGFEFGYTLDTPDGLVLWEAQFGDFANGAQVIIDQYISSAEQKWGRLSGLVLLLPHGFEGQGPEHSSARLERFLQLCAQDNLQVANLTTPANYFHLLRRQALRPVRKPLVLMTPKSLLRHPLCTSSLDELEDTVFRRVIADPRELEDEALERVVFCSGRVYYDLVQALERHPRRDRIAIHRLELLYPFPDEDVAALLADVSPTAEVVWCQEEPRNMGAWSSLFHWFAEVLPDGRPLRYAGRPEAASPATGSHQKHKQEQDALIAEALGLDG